MSSDRQHAAIPDARPWLGVLAGAVALTIWAGWISATRLAMVERVDPLVLALCRCGLPAAVLSPLIWRRGLIPRGANMTAVCLMALGWGAPFVLLVGKGLATVPASLFGPLVPALAPILVALMARLFFGVRPGPHLRLGLILIALSVAAVVGNWLAAEDLSALSGVPYLLSASVGLSLYTVMFGRSGLSALEAAAYISLYSLPMLAVWWMLSPDALRGIAPATWAFHLVTQGLLAGMIAVMAYGTAVRHLGPARGSTVNAIVPVAAALVGMVALGERLGPTDWLAVALASLGVAAANGAFRRR